MNNKLRTTTCNHIYTQIRQRIISGYYEPGQKLAEVTLAKELGVSPTPVREAFKKLSSEGFLHSTPYSGVHVKKHTLEEVKDSYKIRAKLEVMALNAVMSDLNHARLNKVIDSLEYCIENEMERNPLLRFKPFHESLIEQAQSQVIIQVLTSFDAILNIDTLMKNIRSTDLNYSISIHEELLVCIKQNNLTMAESIIETIVINVLRNIMGE